MMGLPKRSVEEIVTLHELESEPVDVYVEGDADGDVLRWVARHLGTPYVQVYCVDSVEVPADDGRAISGGCRGRLIALARALEGRIPANKVSCVCDKDFEPWCPSVDPERNTIVLFTDFANLEAYYFSTGVLSQFLSLAVGCSEAPESVLGALEGPLRRAFLIRLAHAVLDWPLHWIDLERSCKLKTNGEIVFREDEHLTKLLQKNGHARQRDKLALEMSRLEPALSVDSRHCIHGHDFSELLHWYLRQRGYRRYGSADQVFRTMLASADPGSFGSYPLMVEIVRRARNSSSAK